MLTLHQNLTAEESAVQVKAATVILDRALRALDAGELATLVEELRLELEYLRHGYPLPDPPGAAAGNNGR